MSIFVINDLKGMYMPYGAFFVVIYGYAYMELFKLYIHVQCLVSQIVAGYQLLVFLNYVGLYDVDM